MNELVFEKNDKPVTTSLKVADYFERQHQHIIRTVENLTASTSGLSEEFVKANFQESHYKDVSGKKNKMYLMTKDGFAMVAMEFKTAKARRFKESYIAAFNEMASFIRQLETAKAEFHELTDAIKFAHDGQAHNYHFSNEFDLINRIVFGMSTKKFRKERGVPETEGSVRPYLTDRELNSVIRLQRFDAGLIVTTPEYDDRKRILTEYHNKVIALPVTKRLQAI